MKITTEVILTPIFVQSGEFTNRETNQKITFYKALVVSGETCDSIGVKADIVSKIQLNKKTRFALEVDTDGKQKPKLADVLGIEKNN